MAVSKNEQRVLLSAVERLLAGRDIHVDALKALEGLDWKLAGKRPEGAPHSVFQLLNHMTYWQEWVVKWLKAEDPPLPEHAAESWPDPQRPASQREWKEARARFEKGRDELGRLARELPLLESPSQRSCLEMVLAIAAHNSHHLGQMILLRRIGGSWPPPSGGLTW